MSLECKRLPVVLPEATMSRTIFRRVAEVLGIAGYCALHAVIPVVISLGTSLAPIDKHPRVYYLVTGAGYLLAWGVLFRALKGRRLLDRTSPGRPCSIPGWAPSGGLGRHFFPDLDEATAAIRGLERPRLWCHGRRSECCVSSLAAPGLVAAVPQIHAAAK